MRRPFAPLALLAIAALWTGCSSDNSSQKTATPERNSTTTTTTTTAPAPSATTTNASNSNANKAPGGAPTGIKPPMKNDK